MKLAAVLLLLLTNVVVDAKKHNKGKKHKAKSGHSPDFGIDEEAEEGKEETPLQAAIKAAKKGDYEGARTIAEGMIEEDATNAFAFQLLSQVSLMEGKHTQSWEEAKSAEALAPNDDLFKSGRLFHEAIVEQDAYNLPRALELFKESVDVLETKDVRSLEKAIIAIAALGDIPSAATYLRELWALSTVYTFHNSLPFVRIVDEYEDLIEVAKRKGTLEKTMKELSNITTVTDTVYFDVSFGGTTKRVEMGLYGHACPVAVANIVGLTKCADKKKCYKGTTFHRIIKDFIVQGGDVSPGDGTGRVNMYDRPFADEVFALALMHSGPGVVQMANSGPDSNGGQFVIMTQAAAHLNGAHVVIGKITKGMEHIHAINAVEVDVETYKPKSPVTISDCGVL